jgi:uncharacterized membrane protein YecN with MAPEG domain
MMLTVTSLLAGIFALMMVPLSLQVSMRRFKLQAAAGDGGDETLRRRIRAHGNFIEYAPMALVVVGLVEYNGAPPAWVGGLAAAFVASRVLHALGMLYMTGPALRAAGMIVQHAGFVLAGVWLLRQAL